MNRERFESIIEDLQRMQSKYCLRGARMQILRESMDERAWRDAIASNPEMADWFDEDGIPK